MSREWRLFLADMIEFCERVIQYTDGLTREQFESERKTYDATIRNVELIGEAAKNLPDDVTDRYPDIPWRRIKRTRNILAHVYFGVDNDTLWNIIQNEIRPLLDRLREIEHDNP